MQLSVLPAISEIAATEWDALANPPGTPHDPFLSHAFLAALEESGAVSAPTGWQPAHLVLRDGERLAGVAPTYLKAHSMGEYVFDHSFARAYEAAGGEYYPKLQIAVPFTPVPGRRLLAASDADGAALLQGALAAVGELEASSLHITFTTQGEWERLGEPPMLRRTDTQFLWRNAGYGSFDEFLGCLSARKRKAIRRERAEAVAGLDIVELTGTAIAPADWDAMFGFYLSTGARKWGRPYLNRATFTRLAETMADRILMILARRDGRTIAGALNFIGDDCLYGRYWGASESVPFLHFELCYYRSIDHAIAHKLTRIEAGAQGEHKLARGYLPSQTYSLHGFADASLARAVARYLRSEQEAVAAEAAALTAMGPFRKDLEETD